MNPKIDLVLAMLLLMGSTAWGVTGHVGADTTNSKLTTAEFGPDNDLRRPENIESWVFLGATMGMTYVEGAGDPADPGLFSSVFMPPEAYEYFLENGEFADGTMFAKIVRETESSDGGFSMGEILGVEAHVKDRERFPKYGFNFYFFPGNEKIASAMPEDNACVACHMENALFDNVFTQFYPSLKEKSAKKK